MDEGAIGISAARQVLPEVVRSGRAPRSVVAELGLAQVSDTAELEQAARTALETGGSVIFPFTTAQRLLKTGPTSPDHLLEPGELCARFDVAGWTTMFYEETREPEAVARLAAARRSRS